MRTPQDHLARKWEEGWFTPSSGPWECSWSPNSKISFLGMNDTFSVPWDHGYNLGGSTVEAKRNLSGMGYFFLQIRPQDRAGVRILPHWMDLGARWPKGWRKQGYWEQAKINENNNKYEKYIIHIIVIKHMRLTSGFLCPWGALQSRAVLLGPKGVFCGREELSWACWRWARVMVLGTPGRGYNPRWEGLNTCQWLWLSKITQIKYLAPCCPHSVFS